MDKTLDRIYYIRKSKLHSMNDRFDQELVVIKRLISIDPKSYENHYSWARVRRDQDEDSYAGLKFRELAILNPRDHRAFNNLGICFANQGRYDNAIIVYNKAMEITTNVELLNNMAITFTKMGDYEQASEYYAKALALRPSDEYLHNCIGYLHFLQGKYKAAIAKLDDAISYEPGYCLPYFNKALVLFCQNGLEDESKEVFRKGVLTLSGRKQQKLQRLRSNIRLYSSELSGITRELESSGVTLDRKNQLENLKKGFEYILDLLEKETKEVE